MCGIVAVFSRQSPVSSDALRRATRALDHRGPVLREAAKPFLTETVYKRQKHPFLAPVELRSRMRELVEDTLRGPVLTATPFFDRAAVLRFLASEPPLDAEPAVRGPYFATQLVLLSACVLQQRYGLA